MDFFYSIIMILFYLGVIRPSIHPPTHPSIHPSIHLFCQQQGLNSYYVLSLLEDTEVPTRNRIDKAPFSPKVYFFVEEMNY